MSGDVLELVTSAGPVAKFVLFVLLCFSIVSWGLIAEKVFRFHKLRSQTVGFVKIFRQARRPAAVLGAAQSFPDSPLARMYSAAYPEFSGADVLDRVMQGDTFASDRLESVHRALRRTAQIEIARMERYLPFLATTASASPFVGLFGTVWGVMAAFHGIGREGSAGLAVVAPGISEALVATAAGLAAAIPAVIAYNYFVNRVRSWATEMDGFILDLLNILSRPMPRLARPAKDGV